MTLLHDVLAHMRAGRWRQNVFNVFLELHKCLFGMGCKAQCAVHSPAMDKHCNAADRPKRHLPEGLE